MRKRVSHQHNKGKMRGRGTYAGSRGSEEDETAEVGGALVGERAGGVDEGADSVGLEGGADEGGTPGDGGGAGLLGAEEFLLAVGGLGALVGLAEEGGQDCCERALVS